MAALCSRCGHILPCGFFFFSLPNLSHRRLDVCHTYTHGVALVQIWDAGLKGAARSLLKMRDAKYRQKFAICAPSYNFVGLYRSNLGTYRQSRKKLVKQQYLLQMSSQYGVLRPTSGWDRFVSLGHPANFNIFACWIRYCSHVAQRKPTRLCTMFGCLLGWYTIYAFSGTLGENYSAFSLFWMR